ncbi:uncharacterized protein [Eleutherodactylus coqui]|uniref:uncharacterized protein n=1 Tax=Eleutherodactylus coqui TaxID=57060 RepID=UPI0034631373
MEKYPDSDRPGNPVIFSYSDVDVNKIIAGATRKNSYLEMPTVDMLLRKWEMENKKNISLSLHMSTLCEYFKVKRIPRGLRPHVRPTLMADNKTFCSKFEGIVNKFSFDMIVLNVEFLQLEIAESTARISSLEKNILEILTPEDWNKHKEKKTTYLKRHQEELESIKKTKWFRDVDDYAYGRVFCWQTSKNKVTDPFESNTKQRRQRRRQPRNRNQFGFSSRGSISTDDSAKNDHVGASTSSSSFFRPWQSKQDEEKRGTFRCRRGGRKHHRAYKRSRRGDDPIHETTTADGLQEIVDVGACEPTSDGCWSLAGSLATRLRYDGPLFHHLEEKI